MNSRIGLFAARALPLALVIIGLLQGCTPIQEPWVEDEEMLKQERERSMEQQQALRQRLAAGQADR